MRFNELVRKLEANGFAALLKRESDGKRSLSRETGSRYRNRQTDLEASGNQVGNRRGESPGLLTI